MSIYSSDNNKDEFLKYLKKNRVSEEIISKFVMLPETVERDKVDFKLQIVRTYISVSPTSYNFELNYYSEDLVEYLFNSKVFTNVEISINYLLCELTNNGYIKEEECEL